MTLIVGLVSKFSIIVASESRTSDLVTGRVKDDARKIHPIRIGGVFENVLIATSGHNDLGLRAVEMIEKNVREIELKDYRSVADVVQNSIADLKRELRNQYPGTPEEQQRHFEQYGFELMIAHFFNNHPYIFTVDFALGQAVWHRSNQFVCTGCGSLLAQFILGSMDLHDLKVMERLVTAVYVIEEVKRIDMRCGGPVQAAMMFSNDGIVDHFHENMMQDISETARRFGDDAKLGWKKRARELIEATSEQQRARAKQNAPTSVEMKTALEELRNQQTHE